MDIKITLRVEDPEDVDDNDRSGLTEAAYNRLLEAVNNEGFSIVSGPSKV